ncbi:G-protein coupled receptor Mth2 [Portunus trituberculatus]|uniref:G-protein coupled receptor Mth2 n=1 Tax=Portunus trituberculatus TaxID=210409 RepID=A0A5B7G7J4_PORTR|nr:G-protein coupled receptor Mth2 [Portunus trituberculatus]
MAHRVALLAVVCLAGLSAAVQYSDLEAMNVTCAPKDTCHFGKGPRLGDSTNWKSRNCFCDDLCADYGDCCLDANAYDPEVQVTAVNNHQCVHLRHFGDIYMKGTCMDDWQDQDVADMCAANSPDSNSVRRDPLASFPATSYDTAITYANYFCAVCNNDSTSLEIWKPRLECPTLASYQSRFRNLTMAYVAPRLEFREKHWGLHVEDGGFPVFHTCYMDPVMPETVGHLVRPCKHMIRTCAANWTNTEVEDQCHSYTAVMYAFDQAFRNVHCALCNHETLESLGCQYGVFTRFYLRDDFNPGAFALLFDYSDNGGNVVGSACGNGEVFDPFFKKCRNVVCGKAGHQYRFGRCVYAGEGTTAATTAPPSNTTEEENTSQKEEYVDGGNSTTPVPGGEEETATSPPTASSPAGPEVASPPLLTNKSQSLSCERFLLPADEYAMSDNGTVVVEKYGRTYLPHEYERREGGILVCIIQPEVSKFSRLMGWVTLAGLGLSCVCLLLHLVAFLLVPDLRNLSGKNLASLCLVLLAAYATFILSVFGEPGKRECFVLAAAMYYFFLSSFCWMNVMALDIWRTLRMATSELRVSSGKQWVKFSLYSLYGWLAPALALVVLVTLDLVRPEGMPEEYYPFLGERWCWFGHRKALLVFFAAPLMAIMVVNIALFILSAVMIAETTQSTAKMTSCSPHHHQFKLYMRLALLMGVSWISGIVAGYLQMEAIWYVFVLFNTLQGVLLFLGFTCTRKVWHVAGAGCWRRVCLATSRPWVSRSPSSSRQGLESRDSHDSQLSAHSHSSVTHLASHSRTSVDAF